LNVGGRNNFKGAVYLCDPELQQPGTFSWFPASCPDLRTIGNVCRKYCSFFYRFFLGDRIVTRIKDIMDIKEINLEGHHE
jgi:hypothetical protein